MIGYGKVQKSNYQLYFCNRQMVSFLSEILPYLRLKDTEAKLVLEACHLLRHKYKRIPQKLVEQRLDEIALMIKNFHSSKGVKINAF